MSERLFVKMATSAWDTQIARATELLENLSDAQLSNRIAPGKNTGIYLVGHLIAIHDAMNDILGFGSRSHAELDKAFVENPDGSGLDIPATANLRQYWNDVHSKLNITIKQLSPQE